jgi:Cys-rich protein (TIGR01571 family)
MKSALLPLQHQYAAARAACIPELPAIADEQRIDGAVIAAQVSEDTRRGAFPRKDIVFPLSAAIGIKMASPAQDPLPPGWAEFADPQGRTYYAHSPTQTVSWDRPTAAPPPPPPPPAATTAPLGGSSSDESVVNARLLSNDARSDMPPEPAAESCSQVQASPQKWTTGLFDCVRPAFDPDTQVGLCFTSWYFPFLTQGSAFSKMGLTQNKKELTCLFCLGWCEGNTGIGLFTRFMITSAQEAGARLPIGCYLLDSCAGALIQSLQATIAASHFRRAMIMSAYKINGGVMSCQDVLTVCCCAPCELNQSMRQLAASPFPQHSFPPSQTGEWSSGLFDCLAETELAALTWCCFPILTARASNFIATRGQTSECLTPFGLTQCLTSPGNALFRRTLIRQTLGIKGSVAGDFAAALFCSCCSLAQEVRHLRRHCGFQPDGSFSGRNFHAQHEN